MSLKGKGPIYFPITKVMKWSTVEIFLLKIGGKQLVENSESDLIQKQTPVNQRTNWHEFQSIIFFHKRIFSLFPTFYPN